MLCAAQLAFDLSQEGVAEVRVTCARKTLAWSLHISGTPSVTTGSLNAGACTGELVCAIYAGVSLEFAPLRNVDSRQVNCLK
jgi:hypothetical protein